MLPPAEWTRHARSSPSWGWNTTANRACSIPSDRPALGDRDAAFRWADDSIEHRDPIMLSFLWTSSFDALRGDPRFAGLLKTLKLEDHDDRAESQLALDEFRAFDVARSCSAIEMDLFTRIGEGANTIRALAVVTRASERGLQALCDDLTVQGIYRSEDHATA